MKIRLRVDVNDHEDLEHVLTTIQRFDDEQEKLHALAHSLRQGTLELKRAIRNVNNRTT